MLCILEYIQSENQVQNTKKAFLTTLMDKVYLLVSLKTLGTFVKFCFFFLVKIGQCPNFSTNT